MKKKDLKEIVCRMVEATKIVPKDKTYSKRSLKSYIRCSDWSFPCESYSYKKIKENLEKAICEILNLESVEIKDFQTSIVEYP